MSKAAFNRVFVVGVGMTNFLKPGGSKDYPELAKEAITKALADASLPYEAVEQAAVGYVYGDSTCGQRALYEVGITGIPVYNVNNNCATGSSALFMARQFVQGGLSDCVLAFGFEKMEKGSLGAKFNDRTNPMDKHVGVMVEAHGLQPSPVTAQLFGNAGVEHMKKFGTKPEHFAKIAEKNHRHSANNPYSQFRDIYTLEQVLKSPAVHGPLTKLQCCPTSDGAGAAIVCSERFVYKYGLQAKAVEIVGMSMKTDFRSTFDEQSMMKLIGYDMTQAAANEAMGQAGISAKDVQVIELHDCFSANELITYEALGLCPPGGAGKLIDAGDNTYGGKWVVNPSGGLISKGHPLGATGLAQCAELVWQIRGEADKRQVKNVKYALQHNLGLGGAAVVAVYRKPVDLKAAPAANATFQRGASFVGSVPAVVQPAPVAAAKAAPTSGSAGASGLAAEAVFAQMKANVNADLVKKVNATFRFDVSGAGGAKKSWVVDLKNGSGAITESEDKADCMITIADADFGQLVAGKLNPQQAFMQGKIKIKGNMMLAQKLQLLFDANKPKAGAAPAAAPAAKAAAPAAAGAGAGAGEFKAAAIFAELSKRADPELVKRVGATFRFDLTADSGAKKSWYLDLKTGSGSVKESSDKADCMIAMKDSDYVQLMAGKLNPQQAFMAGKIKIQGNMMLAQKLQLLQPPKAKL